MSRQSLAVLLSYGESNGVDPRCVLVSVWLVGVVDYGSMSRQSLAVLLPT